MMRYQELEIIIDKLSNVFISNSGKIFYDQISQQTVCDLLTELAEKSETFDKTIKNERKSLGLEFSTLIDTDSIQTRVYTLLLENNIYTCLKSLALTNKCAHIFDGDIISARNSIKPYFETVYGYELNTRTFSFMYDIDTALPYDFKSISLTEYQLPELSATKFNSIRSILNKQTPKKGEKIGILRDLKVNINGLSDDQLDETFSKFQTDKKYLDYLFLRQQYKKGQDLISLQSKVFAIKNEFTSMIGQLLGNNNQFLNVNYELVTTEPAVSGFNYMLIIDDPELQYYIEIHMPNFIAEKLIKKYQLTYSKERKTIKLGASAVYKRELSEIQKILDFPHALSPIGQKRAKIITRGYAPQTENNNTEYSFKNQESVNITTNTSEDKPDNKIPSELADDYSFITDVIQEPLTLFENFLVFNNMNIETLQFNLNYLTNQNYSIKATQKIVNENYQAIFYKMDNDKKVEFINYSLQQLHDGNIFDQALFHSIIRNDYKYDIVTIGNILINKNILQQRFNKYIKNHLDKLSKEEYKNLDEDDLQHILYNYLNKYMAYGFKEKKNNGFKRKRK